MEDVSVPLYYIASRSLTEAQIATIQRILTISPITCVLITHAIDAELGREFGDEIVCVDPGDVDRYARKLSPVLVIADVPFLDVVYEDGTKESLVPDAYSN